MEPEVKKDEIQEEPRGQGERMPTLFEAIAVMVFACVCILSAIQIWETDAHIPLVVSSFVASVIAMWRLKVRWAVIEDAMLSSILMGMQACLILYTVGMLIGVWILSGVVPSMIYYGLDFIAPGIFLMAALIICSVVSLATGTSWGTTGTVGIALIGVGAGLGIPAPVSAGFIISGAYLGDKMSPLSDTTNLAPAMAGTDLFQHIRAMCWTTIPTYLIVCVVGVIMGVKYSGGTLDTEAINAIQTLMKAEFYISPLCLIPPVIVIGLAAMKKPAVPSIFSGVIAGVVLALVEGVGLGDLFEVLQNGFVADLPAKIVELGAEELVGITALLTGASVVGVLPEHAFGAAETLKELLTRGGLQSMNWTVSLILCALSFGGVLERCGFIEVILARVLKGVKTVGGLIFSVIVSCFLTNALTGDQYISIVVPGRMFKKRFEDVGLHSRMLSRSLEDSGTLTSALIPWNTCGAYQSTTLGVPTVEYLPYAILNWLNPIVAVTITYLGIGVAWKADNAEGFVISRNKPSEQ
jgi:NhaC family Na+:H+ antiporter